MIILVTRYDEVVKMVSERPVAAVLSIEHPGVTPDATGYAPRLQNTPQKILTFWDAEVPVANGPDMTQVEEGIAFAMEHAAKGDIIIHCKAGRSRSTALALGVLSAMYPHDDEQSLINQLLDIRPQAAPNIIVVEFVDVLTGRNGKLLQAVLQHEGLTAARARTEKDRQRALERNPELAYKLFPEKFPNGPPEI